MVIYVLGFFQSKDAAIPNPIDVNYHLLKCGLEVVDPKSEEFKVRRSSPVACAECRKREQYG